MTTVPQISDADGKPNYAALIDPKDSARQMRCLAEAIYFESRSEPEEGQAAVAQVVLNRVRSGIYPTTVCGVVYQDRNRPFACQFTFACEGKSLRVEEPGPWAVATRIAQDVVSGANYNPKVGVAVNYHANYVAPFWVGYLKQGRPHRRPHLLRHARRRELGARRAQRTRRPAAGRQLTARRDGKLTDPRGSTHQSAPFGFAEPVTVRALKTTAPTSAANSQNATGSPADFATRPIAAGPTRTPA